MSVKPNTGRGRPTIMIGQKTATEARAEAKENKASTKSALIDAKAAAKSHKANLRNTTRLHKEAQRDYLKNKKDTTFGEAFASAKARLKEDTGNAKTADKGLVAAQKAYDKSVESHKKLEEKIAAKAGR